MSAADEAGNLAVAWEEGDEASSALIVRERRAGGGWSAPRTLETGAGGFALAAGGNGWLIAAWTKAGRITVARRSPGGTWTTVRDVGSTDYGSPWVGVDRSGNALVIWQSGSHVVGGHLNAGSNAVSVSTVVRDAWLQDARKPAEGRTVVAVRREHEVGVVRAGATGWEPLEVVDREASDFTDSVTLGMDADRNLVLAWRRGVGATWAPPWYIRQTLNAAIFDRTPPVIGSVTVPSTVVAGREVSFAVAATDRLSAVGEPQWSFGDGTATGTSARHTFETAGTRTVTVRVRDTAGNEAVAERRVTVTNPAPVLQGITPLVVRAGADGAELTLTGTGFTATSEARWNGRALPTTYLAPTLLRAQLPAAAVAAPAALSITVVTPAPGGGTSAARTVQVEEGAVVVPPPRSLVAPAVIGDRYPGSLLTCDAGEWSEGPTGYVFRWLRNGQPMPGTSSASVATGTGDVGAEFACSVTAVNAGGSTTAASPPVVILARPTGGGTPPAGGGTPPNGATTTPPAGTQPPAPSAPAAQTAAVAIRASLQAPRPVFRGRVAAFRVVVTPRRAGVPVRLEVRSRGRWTVVARARTAGDGTAVLRRRFTTLGSVAVRVRWQDGATLRATRPVTLRVRRATVR